MESRVYKSIRKSVIEPVQIDKKRFFPVSCNNNYSVTVVKANRNTGLWCIFINPYIGNFQGNEAKAEYRIWNPFRSKLAAAILSGVEKIHLKPSTKVLYLGAGSGTTVSHVSDLVGPVRFFALYLSQNSRFCFELFRPPFVFLNVRTSVICKQYVLRM